MPSQSPAGWCRTRQIVDEACKGAVEMVQWQSTRLTSFGRAVAAVDRYFVVWEMARDVLPLKTRETGRDEGDSLTVGDV